MVTITLPCWLIWLAIGYWSAIILLKAVNSHLQGRVIFWTKKLHDLEDRKKAKK